MQRQMSHKRRGQVAATVVTAVVVVALFVVMSGGGSARPAVTNAVAPTAELAGLPHADMTVGEPDAAVTINEYGDLQCTACRVFAADVLPKVIDRLVKPGAAKLSFHNWTIIDQTDSVAAAEASYAAGRQSRSWEFIELFYRNQGQERSGYVTDAFLDHLARSARLDVARFDRDRRAPAMADRLRKDWREALAYGFQGTPSFAVRGPRGTRVLEGVPDSVQPFDDAVQAVR